MTAISIPEILNRIARAGITGISCDPSADDELRLCGGWGYKFVIKNGRTCLEYNQDSLIPYWIEAETPVISWARLAVGGFFEIGSTNDEALARARAGAAEGLLIFAEMQTAGRGRIGRQWISHPGAGLYFSLVLRPRCEQRFWPLLTHVASVALNITLGDLSAYGLVKRELLVDLKWPNDVLISGKKMAGILLETAGKETAIVGIGINVSKGSVPKGLKEHVTCIGEEAACFVPRRWLLVKFLHNFQIWYNHFQGGEYGEILDQWKRRSSMHENTPIWIQNGENRIAAITCGLTESGALKIQTEQGNREILVAGDVSVRRF
jgi:BirA family biotin operon repressor/biotin-[acetyl-CoA-carboxylase] ligase